ncbi:MAG: hypothetical protein Q8R25_01695 [bacterium]|nr:hypothetical protein [bacterium]
MRTLRYATMILVSWVILALSPISASAQYGDYTEAEFKCVAKAVWYEGGSSGKQTTEEQKLGAYTMLMRKKKVLADPYLERDWGGPDMCSIIKYPKQYSYHSFSYSRIAPVTGDLWVRAQCKLPLTGRLSSCQLWETTKEAVQEVMQGLKDGTYAPPEGFGDEGKETESYVMKGCIESDDPERIRLCTEKFKVKDSSRCYFKVALVLFPNQMPVPESRAHVYYRKKTLEEAITTLHDVPPVCKNARRTVGIMYQSHLAWIAYHGRLDEIPPKPIVEKAPAPEQTKKKIQKKRKKKRGAKR